MDARHVASTAKARTIRRRGLAKRLAALLFSSVCLLCLAPTASAEAIVSIDQGSLEIGYIVLSPCSGEPIEVRDTYQVIAGNVESAHADAIQITHSSSTGAAGIGLESGDTYRIVDIFHFVDDLSGAPDGPYAATLTLRTMFIGPDKGDDFVVTLVAHFTIDATGEGHADVQFFDEICR